MSPNTVTHPGHQKKSLFTKLANVTFEEAKRLNYKFVIGVSNQNSTMDLRPLQGKSQKEASTTIS